MWGQPPRLSSRAERGESRQGSSRKAAQEFSPRRKPWGAAKKISAPQGRKKTGAHAPRTSVRQKRTFTAFMANTSKLTKEERKKSKRTARKKRKAEKPLKPRDYPRGSKKPKVKKLARGQAKR